MLRVWVGGEGGRPFNGRRDVGHVSSARIPHLIGGWKMTGVGQVATHIVGGLSGGRPVAVIPRLALYIVTYK
jgi:hypothetical protein